MRKWEQRICILTCLILASRRNFKLDVGKGREQISETLKIHNRRLLFKSNGVMLCDKALAFLRLI